MEQLFTNPLWWQWVAFGLVLSVSEIIVPSFVIIWFGLAAIVVGFIDLLFATTFTSELFWWILFSALLMYWWFKIFKQKTLTKSGQADEDIGIKGVVIEDCPAYGRGRARFETPVLGSSEWVITSEESLQKEDKIVTIETLGNMLKVKKITH